MELGLSPRAFRASLIPGRLLRPGPGRSRKEFGLWVDFGKRPLTTRLDGVRIYGTEGSERKLLLVGIGGGGEADSATGPFLPSRVSWIGGVFSFVSRTLVETSFPSMGTQMICGTFPFVTSFGEQTGDAVSEESTSAPWRTCPGEHAGDLPHPGSSSLATLAASHVFHSDEPTSGGISSADWDQWGVSLEIIAMLPRDEYRHGIAPLLVVLSSGSCVDAVDDE